MALASLRARARKPTLSAVCARGELQTMVKGRLVPRR
jgi:hypothetical protein